MTRRTARADGWRWRSPRSSGFGDVDVRPEIVAALDLAAVVGGREDDDRRTLGVRIGLDLLQDVDAGHVGQVEIEQDQEVAPPAHLAGAVGPEQEFEGRGPVAKRQKSRC